jgi:carbon storage regulator
MVVKLADSPREKALEADPDRLNGLTDGGCADGTSWLRRKKEFTMLVLSRKKNESIVINNDITIVVVEIRGDKVRLGVEAPKEVPVHRREVYDAIRRNSRADADAAPGTPSENHTASEADQAG